jgi:hypothetical protein
MKANGYAAHRRRRFSPEQQAQLLHLWEHGGVSVRRLAEQHSVAVSTLYLWRRRARTVRPASPGPRSAGHGAFHQVPLAEVFGGAGQWAGEVHLPDGASLRWNAHAAPAVLQAMLTELRRLC